MIPTQNVLMFVVLLLALNHLVLRTPRLLAHAWVWRVLVAVDVIVASAIFVLGIPGFEAYALVRWMVGMLFILHAGEALFLREARLRQWGLWDEDDFDTRVAKLTEEILRDEPDEALVEEDAERAQTDGFPRDPR